MEQIVNKDNFNIVYRIDEYGEVSAVINGDKELEYFSNQLVRQRNKLIHLDFLTMEEKRDYNFLYTILFYQNLLANGYKYSDLVKLLCAEFSNRFDRRGMYETKKLRAIDFEKESLFTAYMSSYIKASEEDNIKIKLLTKEQK